MKKKTVKIDVTQEDIDSGWSGKFHCPIARATRRSIGAAYMATVEVSKFGYMTIYNEVDPHEVPLKNITLPPAAVMFIDQFDNKEKVQPFTFEIEVAA